MRRKVLAWFVLVALLVATGAVFGWWRMHGEMRVRADAGAARAVDLVRAQLAAANRVYGDKANAAVGVLRNAALASGPASLGPEVELGERRVPELRFGARVVNGTHDLVDSTVELLGGTATLFVKAGDDFVRVSTNVK
ncbi:MAG: hypothetical protein RL112_1612, partial [Planctomycetota bacterium]